MNDNAWKVETRASTRHLKEQLARLEGIYSTCTAN
jgi:hypothetical protein